MMIQVRIQLNERSAALSEQQKQRYNYWARLLKMPFLLETIEKYTVRLLSIMTNCLLSKNLLRQLAIEQIWLAGLRMRSGSLGS